MATSTLVRSHRDRLRQALNLVLAIGQPVTTVLAFSMGTSFEEATRTEAGDPPIVPAGYAFIVWAVIYAGSIAYAVYQALPARREDALLRRIGFFTASAFLGTSLWLIAARFGWTWLTVVWIVWILASLAGAFVEFVRRGDALTTAERYLVVLPLSIFSGWVSVATFANTAAALKASGWGEVGLSETGWAVVMIVAAGIIGSLVTRASRGNVGYALTIVWALVGIVVANTVEREQNVVVAAVAGAMALLVASALLWARVSARPAVSA